MRKSTSWLKKGLIGLGLIATLGFSGHKAEAQSKFDNTIFDSTPQVVKEGIADAAHTALYKSSEFTPAKRAPDYTDYSRYKAPKVTEGNESLRKMHINYFHRKNNEQFNKYANRVLEETNNKPPLFYFITLNQAVNREGNHIGPDLIHSYEKMKKESYKNDKPLFYALKSMEYFYGTFGVKQDKQKYENFLDLTLSHLADYTHLEEITGINSEEKFRQYINDDNRTAEELVQLYKTSYGSADKLKKDENFDMIWYAMGAKANKEYYDSKDTNLSKNKAIIELSKSNYFINVKEKYNIFEKMIYIEKTTKNKINGYVAFNYRK